MSPWVCQIEILQLPEFTEEFTEFFFAYLYRHIFHVQLLLIHLAHELRSRVATQILPARHFAPAEPVACYAKDMGGRRLKVEPHYAVPAVGVGPCSAGPHEDVHDAAEGGEVVCDLFLGDEGREAADEYGLPV